MLNHKNKLKHKLKHKLKNQPAKETAIEALPKTITEALPETNVGYNLISFDEYQMNYKILTTRKNLTSCTSSSVHLRRLK